eukprot:1945471-Rhodomonas_salina.1
MLHCATAATYNSSNLLLSNTSLSSSHSQVSVSSISNVQQQQPSTFQRSRARQGAFQTLSRGRSNTPLPWSRSAPSQAFTFQCFINKPALGCGFRGAGGITGGQRWEAVVEDEITWVVKFLVGYRNQKPGWWKWKPGWRKWKPGWRKRKPGWRKQKPGWRIS